MLDRSQLDFFLANGYLVMRGMFHGRELDELRAATDRVVAEGVAGSGSAHIHETTADGSRTYRRSEQMWKRDAIFRAVTVNPDLLAAVGQCIGREFFPWNDSLVVKMPRSGAAVPWHQDPPFGEADRLFTPLPNFTSDIYLDHSDRGNGCVWAIPGHHLAGHVDIPADPEACFGHPLAVPIEMAPGDVLFHWITTPHGSRLNTSERMRRTFYVHYLCQEAFDDCYGHAAWAKYKPGWGAEVQAQVEAMVADRSRLGFTPAFGGGVVQGPLGLATNQLPTITGAAFRRAQAAIGIPELMRQKSLTATALKAAAAA